MIVRSLAFKWTVTLFLTSLIGVILVGIFAFRTTITQFDRLRSEQAQDAFIENITTYYQANGSWDDIENFLRGDDDRDGPPDKSRPPDQFALTDSTGVIVVGHGPFHTGDEVPTSILQDGTSVLFNGMSVGTVLTAQPPPDLDPREQRYVDGTNQALIIGALGAGSTALVIGLLLSRQFLRPLSELTQAITAMRTGDLDQHVEIHSRDELGVLAQTFNEMSTNLARANLLRKQMTADIAHDLRTPLTIIAGYLEALQDGTLQPTSERFHIMSEEVALLQRLVEDLRTLSLADAGELKLQRTTIATHELVQHVAETFQEAATAAGVTLTVDVSRHLPDLWIDNERMNQVLSNLVTNALRHTPSGGKITLESRRLGEAVVIAVCDTGEGIASDDLTKIFDRFYRADPSRQSETGASGLGLAIARSIVEAHGGTITAESKVGAGTKITLMLHPAGTA